MRRTARLIVPLVLLVVLLAGFAIGRMAGGSSTPSPRIGVPAATERVSSPSAVTIVVPSPAVIPLVTATPASRATPIEATPEIAVTDSPGAAPAVASPPQQPKP